MPRKKANSSENIAEVTVIEQTSAQSSAEGAVSVEEGNTGNGKKKRAPRGRKTSKETVEVPPSGIPDEISVDTHVLRDQLVKAGEEAREATREAEVLKSEVDQARERVRATLEQTDERLEELQSQTDSTRQEIDQTRQRQTRESVELRRGEAVARAVFEEIGHMRKRAEEAKTRLEQVTKQADEAEQKLQEIHERFGNTEQFCERIRQDLQNSSRQAQEQSRQLLEDARRQAEEARAELEVARREFAESRQRLELARVENTPATAVPVEGRPGAAEFEVNPAALEREDTTVIQATVRLESPRERLMRYLNHAWSVESALVDELQEMSEDVIEPGLRAEFAQHRQVTQRQKEALAEHLKAMGGEASGGKGLLKRLLGLFEGRQREPDDYNRTMQTLFKASAIEAYEVAMYRTLAALADLADEPATAELARQHLQEEQEAANGLIPYLTALAELSTQVVPAAVTAAEVVSEEAIEEEEREAAEARD